MGACLSCIRGADSDTSSTNENAPLLANQSFNAIYGPTGRKDESPVLGGLSAAPEDRQKREQDLAEVVHSTGDNLIDIGAVEQQEGVLRDALAGGGGHRSASWFKEAFLKELPASTSIPKTIDSIVPRSVSEEKKHWLEVVAKQAKAALDSEPKVKPVGDLVLNFE